MNSPTAALAWELWARHRRRIIAVLVILFFFVIFYGKLCAMAGMDLTAVDMLDEISRKFALEGNTGTPRLPVVVHMLYYLFLACAPSLGIMSTLLLAVWMLTFVEFDARTKDAMHFPARLFNYPVSTSFMFIRLTGGGLAIMGLLCGIWFSGVPMPRMMNFEGFQNVFLWLTVLVLTQGVIWIPVSVGVRSILLLALLWGVLSAPAWMREVDWRLVLVPAFFIGLLLAWFGLDARRHGIVWSWSWPQSTPISRVSNRPLRPFASAGQAQLWYEWRRMGRPLCLTISTVALAAAVIHLALRWAMGLGPMQPNTVLFFVCVILLVAVSVYYIAGVCPVQSIDFMVNRPVTNGQITMAMTKAMAISVALSWTAVGISLLGLNWVGDFEAVAKAALPPLWGQAILVVTLAFVSWRFTLAGLGFILSGRRKLQGIPIWALVLGWFGLIAWSWLTNRLPERNPLHHPEWLEALFSVKLILAGLTFSQSLKRRLISRASVVWYGCIWVALTGIAVAGAVVMAHANGPDSLPVSSAVLLALLVVPLARVGFAPLGLALHRSI